MNINNNNIIDLIGIVAKASYETDEFEYDKNKNQSSTIMRTSRFVVELADFLNSLSDYDSVNFDREEFIKMTANVVKMKIKLDRGSKWLIENY